MSLNEIPDDLHVIGDEAFSASHPQLITTLQDYRTSNPDEYAM